MSEQLSQKVKFKCIDILRLQYLYNGSSEKMKLPTNEMFT